jgi:hypothetical protein
VGRARLEDRGSQLRIVIPSKVRMPLVLFLSLWSAGWLFYVVSLIRGLLEPKAHPDRSVPAMSAWLGVCTLFGVAALASLGWMLLGREVVIATDRALVLRREILGLGRDRAYDLANVKELRWAPSSPEPDEQHGRIAFDYGARTIRFGEGLDEAEAKVLLVRLQSRDPRHR